MDFPKNLAGALLKIQGELSGVVKDSTNPHFKNRYASLETVIDTIKPVMQKHGVVFMQTPGAYTDGVATITTTLIHAQSGESHSATIGLPVAKQDPQGVGSAITYACRYSLMAILGLPPVDDDAQSASTPSSAKPSVVKMQTLPKKDAREIYEKLQSSMRDAGSREHLKAWGDANKDRIKVLPEDWQDILRLQFEELMADLRQQEVA